MAKAKLDFDTQYREHVDFFTCVGDREVIDYAPEYDAAGNWHLVETGKHSLYDEIQSHKDSVDINKLLRRYQNGEIDVLEKVQGVYGDFTSAPKNFAELLNIVNDGKAMFDGLPIEVKERFGQNYVAWMQEFGQDSWLDKMGMLQNDTSAPSESIKEDVSNES